jgi:hypothetical protein
LVKKQRVKQKKVMAQQNKNQKNIEDKVDKI